MNFIIPSTFNHDPPDVLDTSQTLARLNSIFMCTERLGRRWLKQAAQLRVPVTPKITKIGQNDDFPAKSSKSRFPAVLRTADVFSATSLNVNPPVQTVAGHTTQPAQNVSVNAVPATITQSTNFVASVPLPNGTNVVTISAQDSSGAITTQRTQVVTSGSSTGTTSALFYDANGNTGVDENGNRYAWDALNRMTAINYAQGGQSQFVYDGLSRRVAIIEKDATGATTSTKLFLWIGQTLAEERDVQNNVTKRFFAQGEQQAGVNYFYTRDHLGSVRELVDSNDNIVARYDYDVYGRISKVQGTGIDSTFQYAGYYQHAPSGLELTLYRTYDPNTGRWLSRDPIAEQGGINLYGYVGNEPMDRIDFAGLTYSYSVFPKDSIYYIPPDPNYNWINAHGNPWGLSDANGNPIDINKLVNKMLNDPSYDPTKPIKLVACSAAGFGPESPANQIANLAHNNVIAPTGDVKMWRNGAWPLIPWSVPSLGPDISGQPGQWITTKPGSPY